MSLLLALIATQGGGKVEKERNKALGFSDLKETREDFGEHFLRHFVLLIYNVWFTSYLLTLTI